MEKETGRKAPGRGGAVVRCQSWKEVGSATVSELGQLGSATVSELEGVWRWHDVRAGEIACHLYTACCITERTGPLEEGHCYLN